MALKVSWFGSATFILEDSAGKLVVLDPWLDGEYGNPGCPLKVADVDRADLVLVSHGHPAHFGRGDSVKIAAKVGCPYASNPVLCGYVVGKGLLGPYQVVPLALNQRHDLGFIEVMPFPVVHPPWTDPENHEEPGEPNTGLAFSMGGVPALYTGDTILGDDVYRGVAAAHPPLLALLPIGGFSPHFKTPGAHGTLEETVETAASIARMVGASYVIPHYRYAPDNPGVAMLARTLEPDGVKVVGLEPGGSLSLEGLHLRPA